MKLSFENIIKLTVYTNPRFAIKFFTFFPNRQFSGKVKMSCLSDFLLRLNVLLLKIINTLHKEFKVKAHQSNVFHTSISRWTANGAIWSVFHMKLFWTPHGDEFWFVSLKWSAVHFEYMCKSFQSYMESTINQSVKVCVYSSVWTLGSNVPISYSV